MNSSLFHALSRALHETPRSRRDLALRIAGLTGIAGVTLFELDEAEARKRKRKGKKRRNKSKRKNKQKSRKRRQREEPDEQICQQTQCGDACVNLNANPDHCGACDAACQQGSPCVGGLCVEAVGGEGSGLEQFRNPSGIGIGDDRFAYVADTGNNRLIRLRGGEANAIITVDEFRSPVAVAVSSRSGEVYAVDKDVPRVFRLNANGEELGAFGGSSEQDGGFQIPAGIAVSSRSGQVVVSDFRRDRLNQFTADGAFLFSIGSTGDGDGEFNQPLGMAFNNDSSLFIADSANHRIQVLNISGGFQRAFGRQGSGEGEFDFPVAVAVDEDDTILIVDQGNNRIQRFTADGQFLQAFGRAGSALGEFDAPTGIIVDGSRIQVLDAGNNRIQIFTPGGFPSIAVPGDCRAACGDTMT